MNRLETIALRQRKSRTRDVMFAVALAIAGLVAMSSVAHACEAATTSHVHIAQR